MTNNDIITIIRQEARATRTILKSMHAGNTILQKENQQILKEHTGILSNMNSILKEMGIVFKESIGLQKLIHKENLESQERFRQTLERWGKPGEN